MKSIFLTGSTGFVGSYLQIYFRNKFSFFTYKKNSKINITEDIVLHFAGIAHDLKNNYNKEEYYKINTDFTIKIFEEFLKSNAEVFIFISSVKAAADSININLTEKHIPNPITDYGKSKLLAEKYILSKNISNEKRIYILRPCMIHGPGNKGNLNLLYQMVSKGIPWPLGAFKNKRSFCSIDNLCFIIQELIKNDQIPSGIYNIADDEPISTIELINLISESLGKKVYIWKIPQFLIIVITKLGDLLRLPLNTERLMKLTENYIVSNEKIRIALKKELPLTSKAGLIKTLNSFGKIITP